MTAADTRNTLVDKREKPMGETKDVLRILLGVLVFVDLWATSIVTWGVPGLYIPAVALVLVMFVALFLISRG